MEDGVLEKIAKKVAENYDSVRNYYFSKSNDEILREAKNENKYDNVDVFISNGMLYEEINFRRFRVTTVLNYIFNGGNFGNIVGILDNNGKIKLYEKSYPNQIRKRMIGTKLHEIAEEYASKLDDFKVEESLSAEIDGDTVVGRLDLVHKDENPTIIDIKTGKLHEDLTKIQLAVYTYMYSKKYGMDGKKINVAIVHPEGIYKDVYGTNEVKKYLRVFIDAKREMKKELSEGKFYIFKRVE